MNGRWASRAARQPGAMLAVLAQSGSQDHCLSTGGLQKMTPRPSGQAWPKALAGSGLAQASAHRQGSGTGMVVVHLQFAGHRLVPASGLVFCPLLRFCPLLMGM